MADQPSEEFPKSARVFKQRDFDRAFKSSRVIADSVLVIHVTPNGQSRCRLGISMSRKVGNAVVRNYWKRLIREAFRRRQHAFAASYDLVVRPRKGAVADYQAILDSFANCQRRLAKTK
ncbi:MAG: ribonuclease P protein component [Planctomycetota bacterium]